MACIYLLNSRGGLQRFDFDITYFIYNYSYPLPINAFLKADNKVNIGKQTCNRGRSPQIYTVRQCVTWKKGTFLLISLSQILYYTLQTTWYGMTKNILGKLQDHWWLQINTFNFERCHTLTRILKILIIITFFNPIDG